MTITDRHRKLVQLIKNEPDWPKAAVLVENFERTVREEEAEWWQKSKHEKCHWCCDCEASLCLHSRSKCNECERLASLRGTGVK